MNSEKNDSLLIVGCGWIGKKLGQHASEQGYTVFGTTRSSSNFSDLSDHNIKPVKLEMPTSSSSEIRLPETDSVLISISPGRGDDRTNYPTIIRQLAHVLAERNAQIIMYSSSGVYGSKKGLVHEHSAEPNTKTENILLAAEGELYNILPEAVILRLSGLYGEDRHPANYLAGRKNLNNGDAPVNLVHRDDVIRATELVIEKKVRGEIFNICAPVHPPKKVIYTEISKLLELKAPKFRAGGENEKMVSPNKFMQAHNFTYKHSDPLNYNPDSV